jgi:PAS domain S-box-containing protein
MTGRVNEASHTSEERQAFLLALSDALRPLTDPVEIQVAASRLLGEYLAVSRAMYAEIVDETWADIRRDYVNGIPSMAGRVRIEDFGAVLVEGFRSGEPLIVDDVTTDARFSESERRALITVGSRANLSVGLVKGSRWIAALSLHQASPRVWTPDELRLVQEVAERTWATVERARAEGALEDSEQRYRTLFESIDEGFCVFEMLYDEAGRPVDYRFLEVNPAFEKQTGLADAQGRTIRSLVPGHEWYWFDIYGQVAATGQAVRFQNRGEGMGRWFDVYAFRLGRAEDRRVAAIFTDITERKLAEQALRDADRRKDEFLATLAHELRNPLAPIRQAAALGRAPAATPAQVRWSLDVIDRQTRHMALLLDDLLDMSRITRGRIQLNLAVLDLRDAVESALETARPHLESRRHALEVSLPAEPMRVNGDALRLAQVMANLLTNAARYTEPGGRVWLSGRVDGSMVEVVVADNGIGIAADQLEHVFEMFGQGGAPSHLVEGGLGIGLSLARGLVALHGGSLDACSQGLGQGSSFVVRLPCASEIATTPAQAPLALGARPNARKILVVDDNRDAADTLATLLRLDGHEVAVVRDGEAAVNETRRFHPEVVLLDLGMPRVDGLEAARRLRATDEGRNVLLIAITGWGLEEDRRRTREAGFDEHLTKPVDMGRLEAILARRSER